MELYKEILIHALAQQSAEVSFPGLELTAEKLVGSTCCKTLEWIKAVVHDHSLSDPECFRRIEEIILELEAIGSSGGDRHDF